jgi:hypothetical protein
VSDRGPSRSRFEILVLAVAAGGVNAMCGTAFAQSACAPPASAPPVCLKGTITSAKVNVAMVEEAGHSGIAGLRLGDTILDWRVLEIAPKYIKLGKAEQTVTVDVGGPPAVPAPAPAPTGPGHRHGGG